MLHDLSAVLTRICEDLNTLHSLERRSEQAKHIGLAKSRLSPGDSESFEAYGYNVFSKGMTQHDKIHAASLSHKGLETLREAMGILRKLSPAFDLEHLPVKVQASTPGKRHPRLTFSIFGRDVGSTQNPIELPRVLAALDALLPYLATVRPQGQRRFQVGSLGTYITAHTPEDALRIHAALSMPRLFDEDVPAPKIMEHLDAEAALHCLK